MSSSSLFVPATSFNADTSLGFSAPKVNSAGGKAVNIMNTDTKKQLVLSTPLMLTWGLNEHKDETTGKCSYDLSLQFPSDNYPNIFGVLADLFYRDNTELNVTGCSVKLYGDRNLKYMA